MKRSYKEVLPAVHPREKMLFLAGPRQVGKTTLARSVLAEQETPGLYLNWDISADRRRILSGDDLLASVRRPGARPMVVLDELHKMRRFKGWLKGFYDESRDETSIWVTGSGRLDLYQKGGDSLAGRYFLYRLHPLSLGELGAGGPGTDPDETWRRFEEDPDPDQNLEPLLRFGGFPEPFLKQTETFHRRWVRGRRARVTHEDIRDLTRIEDLDRLEHLVHLLDPRIGSPLSLNSLREDLDIAFETVRGWLAALARVYYVFPVRPFRKRIQRSLRQQAKYYYHDWSEASDPAARFENLVMAHLAKASDVWTDLGLGEFDLWYLRDREKREVDALITRDRKPWLIAEVKLAETRISRALLRFAEALDCPRRLQIVATPGVHLRTRTGPEITHVVSGGTFLAYLP